MKSLAHYQCLSRIARGSVRTICNATRLARIAFLIAVTIVLTFWRSDVYGTPDVSGAKISSTEAIGVSWPGSTYSVNVSGGTPSILSHPGEFFNAMARNSVGEFVASDASNFLRWIDPNVGNVTSTVPIIGFGHNETSRGLAFTDDDRLFSVAATPQNDVDNFYEIDVSTGNATLVGSTGMFALQSLAFSAEGVMYSFDIERDNDFGLVTIDLATGVATDVNPLVGRQGAGVQSLAFAGDGTLYAIVNRDLFRVDVSDGSLFEIVDFDGSDTDIRGMEFVVIPESSALVLIDIKPGSSPNSVNLKSKGVLPVAILSTKDFDATEVDFDSLLFGDPLLIDNGGTAVSPLRSSLVDISGDGLLDLTLKFSTADLVNYEALGPDTIEGLLTGELLDGTPFEGMDSIRIVPPNGSKGNNLQIRAVPEPSTLALTALGLLGIGWRRRKRAKRA